MILKIIISTFIWLLLTCNSFGKVDIKLKMMQEQKFEVHNALRSIKGINTFLKDKWSNNVYEKYVDTKQIENLLILITFPISAIPKRSVVLSHSVVSDSLRPHGLKSAKFFCLGILQARILEWVAFPFSRTKKSKKFQFNWEFHLWFKTKIQIQSSFLYITYNNMIFKEKF